jgi:hypothetical protein
VSLTLQAPLSATAALKQTTQILSSTTKTTKAVLTTFADTKWWQSTIKTLKQPTKRQISETVVYDNDKFEKQGCHPFYEGHFTQEIKIHYTGCIIPVFNQFLEKEVNIVCVKLQTDSRFM